MLSGLLAWNLFAVSLSTGAQSVVANANLVKKGCTSPRDPSSRDRRCRAVDSVLQSMVYFAFLVAIRYGLSSASIWLYPLAFVAPLLLTVAVTFWVSSMNVRYRDP